MARSASGWSYNAGVKGKNWVRAYEDNRSGTLFVEWREPVLDPATGEPVLDPRTGKPSGSTGTALPGEVRHHHPARGEGEGKVHGRRVRPTGRAATGTRAAAPHRRTPAGPLHQGGDPDRRAGASRTMIAAPHGSSGIFHRTARPQTAPGSAARIRSTPPTGGSSSRSGGRDASPGFGPVRDRVIEYDLKFLIAVLAWGVGAEPDAAHHIAKNPWSRERRRAQKMVMPREKNPRRPSMTPELHEALLDHSPNWRFEGVMEICRETMHRGNSVRQLQWDDIDLRFRTVRWRGEFDKNGLEIVAPLTGRAVEVLERTVQGAGQPVGVPGRRRIRRNRFPATP